MIKFEKRKLSNGLTVIIHPDKSTPMCATNLTYKVGSKNEDVSMTGFAHLFEHLMFGGSVNVPDFDEPLQLAGGENNAFTNADITNFYNTLPAPNIETALWVEADRMKNLIISQETLDIQKKVVVEEFKETCLNQPYGDVWHLLTDLSYKEHSYRWPTIGLVPEHIKDANLNDVLSFFNTYYNPNNAVLVIGGNVEIEQGLDLAEKWFGDIKNANTNDLPKLKQESAQTEKRYQKVKRKVPLNSIYRTYHMGPRLSEDYYAADLLSDVLSNGRSSRFYQELYKGSSLFSKVDAYITGANDPGLFMFDAKLSKGVKSEDAWALIDAQIDKIKSENISDEELEKIKNKTVSSILFSDVSLLNRVMSIGYFEALGNANLINEQEAIYDKVTADDIRIVANKIFSEENSSELEYLGVV